MSRLHFAAIGFLSICLALGPSVRGDAVSRTARRHVRDGLRQHTAGDYGGAADSFAKAAEELPDDPRVAFDQACALAAQGKDGEAASLFQRAAAANDQQLVAASHYNLGCLAGREAKTLLGEQPEEATLEMRAPAMKLVQQAVAHYRDCLRTDEGHAAARRNLELLRLWTKHMQDAWSQRDRERRREEMNLLEFLTWLDREQRSLEAATKALEQIEGSPRQRQAVAQTEQQQRLLGDEIEPLQRKLQEAVSGGPADQGAAAESAARALTHIASRVKSSMFRAADELAARSLAAARVAQSDAITALDELYRAVAPFEQVLQRAIEVERALVDLSKSALDEAATNAPVIEQELVHRDQLFVAAWSEILPDKARLALGALPAPDAQSASPDDSSEQERHQHDQLRAQEQALRESYARAIELAPGIAPLASVAAGHLHRKAWEPALPQQEEVLRLLEEIAPKTPPQDQQQPDDSPKENPAERPDRQDDQQDQSAGKEEQQPSPDDQQQQQGSPEQDLSRQQAEALLRKVRQRERESRERNRELQRLLQATVPVDKDW